MYVETVGWRATAPSRDYVRIFVTPMRGGIPVGASIPLCSPTWDINGRYQFINQDVDAIKLDVEDLMTGELIAYVNGQPVHTFAPNPEAVSTWVWRPRVAAPVAGWPTIEKKYLLIGGGIAAAVAVAAVAAR